MMCIRDRVALISLVVLSSVIISSGVDYIHGSPIVPGEATLSAGAGNDTKAPIGETDEIERQLEKPPSRITNHETKTLAVILLMLKGGRGAR